MGGWGGLWRAAQNGKTLLDSPKMSFYGHWTNGSVRRNIFWGKQAKSTDLLQGRYEFKLAELLGELWGQLLKTIGWSKPGYRAYFKYQDRKSLLEGLYLSSPEWNEDLVPCSKYKYWDRQKFTWVLRTVCSRALALLSPLSAPCSFWARILDRNIWKSPFIYPIMSISSPVVSLNAGGSLLRFLKPLVLAVGPVLRLDQRRCLRHLFPVAVLQISIL